jgi:hypothetical protein
MLQVNGANPAKSEKRSGKSCHMTGVAHVGPPTKPTRRAPIWVVH